jgi:hypothetical protein
MQKKPEDRYVGIDGAVEALTPLAPQRQSELSSQALTQTPTQPLTRSSIKPQRPVPVGPEPAGDVSAKLNEYLPPSRQTPLPASHRPAPPPLPTRQSVLGEALPTPSGTLRKASPYAGSDPLPPEEPEPPVMGPMGFLALGAVVAVACYLLVTNLMH